MCGAQEERHLYPVPRRTTWSGVSCGVSHTMRACDHSFDMQACATTRVQRCVCITVQQQAYNRLGLEETRRWTE